MFAFLEELMLQNMSLNRRYSMYRIIEIAFFFLGTYSSGTNQEDEAEKNIVEVPTTSSYR